MKAFVYKLRPTRAQEAALERTLETCRHLYNRALAERKEAWETEQRSVGFAAQSASLPVQKTTDPYLPQVSRKLSGLQDVLHRVDRAFQAFFRRYKAGQQPGYPRFRGRGWYDSFCYPQWGSGRGAKFHGPEGTRRLVLSKVGCLKVHADRPLQGKPKTCSVIRRADGWYACIVCEVEPCPLPETREDVGIDLGLEHFATLSNGEQIANPRFYRKAWRQLKAAQRRVSRRQKGSSGRRKAKGQLAKAHLKVKRARLDFCHKTAHGLVARFDTIAVEKLNIRGMVRNHPLALSISDAGWGIFLNVLRAKAASAGRRVVEVNPAGTSQQCSGCGEKVPKKLSQRRHSCPYCDCELQRDHNAALNIQQRAGTPPLDANVSDCTLRSPRTPPL